MADVVGVTAAAFQFGEISFKAVRLINDVRNKIRDSPRELESLQQEISTVRALIDRIERSPALKDIDISQETEGCTASCTKVLEALQGLHFEPSDNIAKKTWVAIGGLRKQEEISNLLHELQRHKSTLDSRIGIEHL